MKEVKKYEFTSTQMTTIVFSTESDEAHIELENADVTSTSDTDNEGFSDNMMSEYVHTYPEPASLYVDYIHFHLTDENSAFVDRAVPDRVMAINGINNNERYNVLIGGTHNVSGNLEQRRLGFIRFDLSEIDISKYDVDNMNFTFTTRKSHDANTIAFSEAENVLRSDETTAWNSHNLTFNNRPENIPGSPTDTITWVNGEFDTVIDLTSVFRNALNEGRTEVTLNISTMETVVTTSQFLSARRHPDRGAWFTSYLTVQSNDFRIPVDPIEIPVNPEGLDLDDLGNFVNNSNIASKIFRIGSGHNGEYVAVDPITESLRLTQDESEAATFALYVFDFEAATNFSQRHTHGVTLPTYAIRYLGNDKFLTIQNQFTKDEFLNETHQYFNLLSGPGSHGLNNPGWHLREFEIKGTSETIAWNERFYIDHYQSEDFFRIFTHLGTMRDDRGFNLFDVRMTDESMRSSAIDRSEYRFFFEEVTDAYFLEVLQTTSMSDVILFWNPVNGDTNPSNYSIDGNPSTITYEDGLLRVTISDLIPGTHDFTVRYDSGHRQVASDVTVRVFNRLAMMHTQEELDRMRDRVQAQQEPWYSDYRRLLATAPFGISSPDFVPQAFPGIHRGADGLPGHHSIAYFERAGHVVYLNALQWVITGDDRYAQAAVDNLNAWAHTLEIIDGRDSILGAGINTFKFTNAAEILLHYNGGFDGYSDEDFYALVDMLLNVVYPVIQDAAIPMYANGNWDLAALISMISIGVLTENTYIFERAVDFYQDIHLNGSIFAYVNEAGQSQEVFRDQAHAQLGVGYMAELAQIAYNQDLDLWGLGNYRLARAFEFAAKYNLFSYEYNGVEVTGVPMPNVFNNQRRGFFSYFDSEAINRGELRPVFELPLNIFTQRGIEMPWTEKAASAMRAQGFVHNDNLNFGTLTQYNSAPTEAPQPYFQVRTRMEPLYQRRWSIVNDQRVAETVNSYYGMNVYGALVTTYMREEAPFFQLIDNRDGTYSFRMAQTNTYLTVSDEMIDGNNLIKANATIIGDNERFTLTGNGHNNYVLSSPAFGNRVIFQHIEETGDDMTYGLKLGTTTLDEANVMEMNLRLIFMFNTEEVALEKYKSQHLF